MKKRARKINTKTKKHPPKPPVVEPNPFIYKELTVLLFFFLALFLCLSLISFHHTDPCLADTQTHYRYQNLFGLVGANVAGFFIGLFGLGAFWIPVLFVYAGLHYYKFQNMAKVKIIAFGGLVLMVATGSLLAMAGDHYLFFGSRIPAGGAIGGWLKDGVVGAFSTVGGALVLTLMWIAGLMITTGLSLFHMAQTASDVAGTISETGRTLHQNWKQGRYRIPYRVTPLLLPMGRNVVEKVEKLAQAVLPATDVDTPPSESPSPEVFEKPFQMGPSQPTEAKPAPAAQQVPDSLTGKSEKTSAVSLDASQKKMDVKDGGSSDQTVKPLTSKTVNGFQLPPLDLLDDPPPRPGTMNPGKLDERARMLNQRLEDFGVTGEVVAVKPGPVITTFEYRPAPGIKINKIVNLTDDLSLALRALSIRIVAPIPGRSVIGIEIPNEIREIVKIKEILGAEVFQKSSSRLSLGLGKDIVGNPVVATLERMPHLLIAGATGTGKSVCLNTMISSFLFKSRPDEVKMIMIDPKRIELSIYNGIPHLITPVVTDMKKATYALAWAVKEMERRYEILSQTKVRNIEQYNRKVEKLTQSGEKSEMAEKLPFIVIIIDELADLMMVASREVEFYLMRLAQMARAAGIHLILATQRPSVNVLTGVIKANFPTRLSFQVSSKTDSRTIIDMNGAESLLGNGDMLFLPPGTAKLQRIQGAYISEEEVPRVIEHLKKQQPPQYDESILEAPSKGIDNNQDQEYDEKYDEAVAFVTRTRQASISGIQRYLRIGYNRAARIVEVMEREGIVGPSDGAKPREVLVPGYDDMDTGGNDPSA